MNIQTVKNKIQNDKILNNISSFFNNEVYLVGGAVRDLFLGKELFDRDLIVIDEDAKTFAKKICEFFDATFVPLDEENKIYRVVLPDKINYLDITNPVENSLELDILRRDLTINSVCINIKTGEIVDKTGGVNDLDNKLIRGIQEQNFVDDPLRILRIFRFHSVLGFEICPELMELAKKYANLIKNPAKERIEYELMKLFSGYYADKTLLKMDECGILEILFPFVSELKQVPPNHHHHLNLFFHSIETVKQVQIMYDKSRIEVQEHMNCVDFGGFSRLAHLKLAAFMHDIGKFSTWTIEKDTGRHRFFKHNDVGADMCVPFLKSLSFSNKQISYIKLMIKNHMYPSMVASSPELNEKVMMRFVRKSFPDGIDEILIAKSDRLSALGPEITDEIVNDNLTRLTKLQDFYIDSQKDLKPLPKLLDGNDVMKILNIPPSAQLGKILSQLHEAQINGDISSVEDAIDFITKLCP